MIFSPILAERWKHGTQYRFLFFGVARVSYKISIFSTANVSIPSVARHWAIKSVLMLFSHSSINRQFFYVSQHFITKWFDLSCEMLLINFNYSHTESTDSTVLQCNQTFINNRLKTWIIAQKHTAIHHKRGLKMETQPCNTVEHFIFLFNYVHLIFLRIMN